MDDTPIEVPAGNGGEDETTIPGVLPRMSDRLAIVGFADGHRDAAPTEGELWGLNRLHAVMERPWTRWFEIHDLGMYDRDGQRDDQHIEWMRKAGIPIYIRPQDMPVAVRWGVETAVPYPIDAVLAVFPRYFTNSISYMLALAIMLEFPHLEVYGVDMAQDSLLQAEYAFQRPSCEFFLGAAMTAGMQIHLPEGSDLLRSSHMYGLEEDGPIQRKRQARMQELGRRKEGLKQQLAQDQAQYQTARGQMEAQWEARRIEMLAGINQLDGAMQQVTYEMRQLSPLPQNEDKE